MCPDKTSINTGLIDFDRKIANLAKPKFIYLTSEPATDFIPPPLMR
jgi:hypothetical protein